MVYLLINTIVEKTTLVNIVMMKKALIVLVLFRYLLALNVNLELEIKKQIKLYKILLLEITT